MSAAVTDPPAESDRPDAENPFPLSHAQLGIWNMQQVAPELPQTVSQYVELRGELDVELLAEAIYRSGFDMQSLRVRIVEIGDQPCQLVDPRVPLGVLHVDLRSAENPRAAALQWIERDVTVPMDVAGTPLARNVVLQTGVAEYFWYGKMHHIAIDGYGGMLLFLRIAERYNALRNGVEASRTMAESVHTIYRMERDYRASADFIEDKRFWQEQVSHLPEVFTLSGRAAPANRQRLVEEGVLTDDAATLLDAARTALRVSRPALFVAGLAGYLAAASGNRDVVLSLPVTARTTVGLRCSAGFVSNVVPLYIPVAEGVRIDELAEQTHRQITAVLAHQRYRHEDIRRDHDATRGSRGLFGPSINIMLFHNEIRLGDTAGSVHVVSTGPVEDLSINIYNGPRNAGLHVDFVANPDRYAVDELRDHHRRFLDYLAEFLAAAPETAVSELALMSATERSLVEAEDAAIGVAAPEVTLVELFEAAAKAHAGATAVKFLDESLSYGQLDARANQLGRRLIEAGVGPESLVAVVVPRSLDLVVALLAVLKAGGGYLPIDPSSPADRVQYLLGDARPVCVVVSATDGVELPAGLPVIEVDWEALSRFGTAAITDTDRRARLVPRNVAYVIYTSGSTGRPKGVQIPHCNVAQLFTRTEEFFGFDERDVWTMFHSAAFDFSVWELWGALLHGGSLVVVDYYTSRSPAQFLDLLRRERVTVLNQTPSAFYQLAEADRVESVGVPPLALRYLVFGGEALELRRLTDWYARHDDSLPRLVNMYGITETTVHVTFGGLDRAAVAAPNAGGVGRAIPGLRILLLDSRLRLVPPGVAGEIYVAGDQLARGYLGRPALTASRFVANRFGGPGARLYRSGDLGRWRPDRGLEYLGRADHQVKIRGFRIELGEIEAALLEHDAVRQAAVIVREDEPGDRRIVAYVVGHPDIAALRDHVGSGLPEYMIPSAFVVIEAIPLTANGKLDRRALPAPVPEVTAYRAPRTPIEQGVARVFAEVLGVDRIGLDDSFFALGGNSLAATRVASRLGAALNTKVPVRLLLEQATVATLAARLAEQTGAGARIALHVRPRPARIPLSPQQRRLWFINRFDPGSGTYNIPFALRMRGELDIEALRMALADVIDRHEALRTIFPDGPDGPSQVILPAAGVAPAMPLIDLSPAEVEDQLRALARRGFDLTIDTALRVELLRTGDHDYVLAVVIQHIAADGWSLTPLCADLVTAYRARRVGEAPHWAPLPVQYADYSLWQRDTIGDESVPGSTAAIQLAYWRSQLAELPDELCLPYDRPRPAVQSYRGGRVGFAIDAETHHALVELARSHNATLFMAVHAALMVLLARISGVPDVAVGTPIAGRGEAELDEVIGMFVNTVVLRTRIDPSKSFADLLARQRDIDVDAFAHAEVPFERLVEVLNPVRSTARHPLFQIMLSVDSSVPVHVELPGVEVVAGEIDAGIAKWDLQFALTESYTADRRAGGLEVSLTYATDLFDDATAELIGHRFARVLSAVAASPAVIVGDIEILSAAERAALAAVRGRPATAPVTLADYFAAVVEQSPNHVAVQAGSVQLTYRELDARANRLARMLIGRGIGANDVVALGYARSVDNVIGWLGVAKAGAAFLPIDRGHPADRIRSVLSDSGAMVGLTTADGAASLPDTVPWLAPSDLDAFDAAPVTDADRVRAVRVDDLAYVIYTSGSTGTPKGVAVTHRGLASFAAEQRDRYRVHQDSRTLHIGSPSFDISVLELLMALCAGATMVIAPTDIFGGDALAEFLARERITHAAITPAALASIDAMRWPLPRLRLLVVGGDACGTELVERWAPDRDLLNAYGPTEATVAVTISEPMRPGGPVVLGRPIRGAGVAVLDARLHPAPPGVAGELYLAGVGLARGYHRRPGLTAGRFIANPHGGVGERMYRTGDLARWTAAGELVLLGRADHQVKIRGFRIELGEIDSALVSHPEVAYATTAGYEMPNGTTILASYVQLTSAAACGASELAGYLSNRVPNYMVPQSITVLDTLPRTAAGKLDRAALPKPVLRAGAGYRAPRSAAESALCEAFAEVLGVDAVGADDSFFELGGSSLLATRVVSVVRARHGFDVPVQALFLDPTPAGVAARLEPGAHDVAGTIDAAFQTMLPIRAQGTAAPLFCVHSVSGESWSYAGLLAHLGPERPVYGLQITDLVEAGAEVDTVELLAEHYVAEIKKVQPRGPYHLLGWSLGGVIAYEIAGCLDEAGDRVALLSMLDTRLIEGDLEVADPTAGELLSALLGDAARVRDEVTAEQAAALLRAHQGRFASLTAAHVERLYASYLVCSRMGFRFKPRGYSGDLLYFTAETDSAPVDEHGRIVSARGAAAWYPFVDGAVHEHFVACAHGEMTSPEALAEIGPVLSRYLEEGASEFRADGQAACCCEHSPHCAKCAS
ncbi:amino acid adenylation domain-containing protein [Nocardia sp. NPDC046473]|uniref:amino acid adenylation domain-containing protein n=1 Tax=Nocardia sp. NPDC046473 TaxID=3155733 RepID=UPI0033ED0658